MQPARLRRFEDFADLAPPALTAVARAARCLRLPAGRWLVRPGRSLPDRYYLLAGRVSLLDGGRRLAVAAPSPRSRRAVYPGVAGVETVTAVELVSIPPGLLDAVAGVGEPLGVPAVDGAETTWQRRFLTSPLMSRLPPGAWQQVLRAMTRHDFGAGEVVVRAGEPATCCYVLSAGSASIVDGRGEVLAALQPGELFGEDALLCGSGRNATVRMSADGSAVSLPAGCFEAWLVEAVTPVIESAAGRQLVQLDGAPRAGAWPLSLAGLRGAARTLPPAAGFAVGGGTLRQRRLAAFLLAEQGLDARPLAR